MAFDIFTGKVTRSNWSRDQVERSELLDRRAFVEAWLKGAASSEDAPVEAPATTKSSARASAGDDGRAHSSSPAPLEQQH